MSCYFSLGYDRCELCEYFNGECQAEAMEKLIEHIKQVFPNLNCYIDDGDICIETAIKSNDATAPDFPQAFPLRLSLKEGGKAEMIADIMSVEDGPADASMYYYNGKWEEAVPKQKWMINPECVIY